MRNIVLSLIFVFCRLGTSHCADMNPSSPKDSAELKAARLLIKNNLNSWLK